MTDGVLPKIELKLNQENELSFKFSIEGNDGSGEKPVFRFLMTEMDSGRGWCFPGKPDGEVINIRIPSSQKESFSPSKKYHGKLEVILGSHYFNPTELMVEFIKPLSISAKPIVKEQIESEPDEDQDELDSVVAPEEPTSFSKMPEPMTPDEIAAFSKVAFTEPLVAPPVVQTGSPAVKPSTLLPKPPKTQAEKELAELKNVLKKTMRSALLDE